MPVCNTEYLSERKSKSVKGDKGPHVDVAFMTQVLNKVNKDGFKVNFPEAFPEAWKVMATSEMKQQYHPSRTNLEYDESQDGLKVLMILLVMIWKKTDQDITSFIKALNNEKETDEPFAGATYRLGALIFATQSSPVSRRGIPIPNFGKCFLPFLHCILQAVSELIQTNLILTNLQQFKNTVFKGTKGNADTAHIGCIRMLCSFTLGKYVLQGIQNSAEKLKRGAERQKTWSAVGAIKILSGMASGYLPTYNAQFSLTGKCEANFRPCGNQFPSAQKAF